MKTRLSKFLAIALVIGLGMFIGYSNAPNNTLQANTVTQIRYVDVPRDNAYGLIDIDLEREQVSVNGNIDTKVIIQKETVEVPKYITKKEIKEVKVPVIDKALGNMILDKYFPLQIPNLVE